MNNMSFVHLHVHSSYSLLEGADRVEDLVKAAARMGMPALAITDTDGLYGALPFVKAATEHGIRPVIGAEITEPGDSGQRAVVLARGPEGYRQLCRLITKRKLEPNFRLSEALWEHHSGAVILAREPGLLRLLREVAEPGGLYAELLGPVTPENRGRTAALLEEADRLGVPVAATWDAHFVRPEGAPDPPAPYGDSPARDGRDRIRGTRRPRGFVLPVAAAPRGHGKGFRRAAGRDKKHPRHRGILRERRRNRAGAASRGPRSAGGDAVFPCWPRPRSTGSEKGSAP